MRQDILNRLIEYLLYGSVTIIAAAALFGFALILTLRFISWALHDLPVWLGYPPVIDSIAVRYERYQHDRKPHECPLEKPQKTR